MLTAPLYDFDEAHRAENAKRMRDHGSFLVPITGSSFDRFESLKIPYKLNSSVYLYYHLERPGLIYWLMILSSFLFGTGEFAYRLPSFLFGLLTIAVFMYFAGKIYPQKGEGYGIMFGLLALIASVDLWLSSMYAQLDTGLTVFLFLSLLSLIYFGQSRKQRYLLVSSISFALAVLSKGQPAVIFGLPVVAMLLLKKLSLFDAIKWVLYSFLILIPWILLLSIQFGFLNVIQISSEFAFTSSAVEYIHLKAPFFWYIRWWFESLRPGWVLFLALLGWEIWQRKLDWIKITVLVYALGGLLFFSLSVNKIWWYVLPLVPALAFYVYLAASDYLKRYPERLLNLSLVAVLGSLPILLNASSKIGLLYGIILGGFCLMILNLDFKKITSLGQTRLIQFNALTLVICLSIFYLRFPRIEEYTSGVKLASIEFKNIKVDGGGGGNKCLWIDHMPGESALFYSDAGAVNVLNASSLESILYKSCNNNYLMTPLEVTDKDFNFIPKKELVVKKGRVSLIKIGQKEQ